MFLFITKALIRLCSAWADLRLCWSHATNSEYKHLRCSDHLEVFTVFIKLPIFSEKNYHSEIVKLENFSFQKDIRSDCSRELMESQDAYINQSKF